MPRKVSLIMIIAGGVVAGFGSVFGSLAVAFPMIVIGYIMMLAAVILVK